MGISRESSCMLTCDWFNMNTHVLLTKSTHTHRIKINWTVITARWNTNHKIGSEEHPVPQNGQKNKPSKRWRILWHMLAFSIFTFVLQAHHVPIKKNPSFVHMGLLPYWQIRVKRLCCNLAPSSASFISHFPRVIYSTPSLKHIDLMKGVENWRQAETIQNRYINKTWTADINSRVFTL